MITEGTKQTIAASLAADDQTLVIGIQGCHNFSRAGVPLAEIAKLINSEATVTVIFDASSFGRATVCGRALSNPEEVAWDRTAPEDRCVSCTKAANTEGQS